MSALSTEDKHSFARAINESVKDIEAAYGTEYADSATALMLGIIAGIMSKRHGKDITVEALQTLALALYAAPKERLN